MTMREYVVVVPARIGSSRLPRKPLLDIHGQPMILRTYARAAEAVDPKDVFVATDSSEIADVCKAHGVQVVMTSTNCLTGTDRLAEVAQLVPARSYINLQGDEPLMPPGNITKVIRALEENREAIVNGWAWITDEAEYRARTIPKVVLRPDGRLLYMSRAPIPGSKSDDFCFARKQVCVYGFPAKALVEFANCKEKTPHEKVEDIEILRFLELGWDVAMLELDGNGVAVDTAEDLEKVRRMMARK